MDTEETIQIVIGKCRLHHLIIASRVRRRTMHQLNSTRHQHARPHHQHHDHDERRQATRSLVDGLYCAGSVSRFLLALFSHVAQRHRGPRFHRNCCRSCGRRRWRSAEAPCTPVGRPATTRSTRQVDCASNPTKPAGCRLDGWRKAGRRCGSSASWRSWRSARDDRSR